MWVCFMCPCLDSYRISKAELYQWVEVEVAFIDSPKLKQMWAPPGGTRGMPAAYGPSAWLPLSPSRPPLPPPPPPCPDDEGILRAGRGTNEKRNKHARPSRIHIDLSYTDSLHPSSSTT